MGSSDWLIISLSIVLGVPCQKPITELCPTLVSTLVDVLTYTSGVYAMTLSEHTCLSVRDIFQN